MRGIVIGFTLVLVAGTGACSAPSPIEDVQLLSSGDSAPASASQPPAQDEVDLARHAWYELIRATDLAGNTTQSLIVGWLDGRVSADLALAEGDTPFGLGTEIQTDGVFDDSVLVWSPGRPGVLTAVGADGSSRRILEVDDEIHFATADAAMSRIFYLTVGPGGEPSGLWAVAADGSATPLRLDYEFPDRAVSNSFRYRLVASPDGSTLAIQGDEDAITVIDIESGRSGQVAPGGRMIGFGDGRLITFGEGSDIDFGPVIAFDLDSLRGDVLIDWASQARVVQGTDGDLVAVERIDPDDVRAYEIVAISAGTGETWVAYTSDPAKIGPHLRNRDEAPMAAEEPRDWVLLVDSFSNVIVGPNLPPIKTPDSAFPVLLNLRTGETIRVGPFRDQPQVGS
jgi:hypothetical protein